MKLPVRESARDGQDSCITEIPNHISSSASNVVKGTAPDDFSPQMNRFSVKKMAPTMPG